MKKEILNILTWIANKATEPIVYDNWSNEFARQELKESLQKAQKELSKHIDWNNLTVDECKELRFNLWQDEEGAQQEINELKSEMANGKLTQDQYDTKVAGLLNAANLWLIPLYLFPIIPIGLKVTCINGEEIVNDGHNLDDDIRFGCVAYGIKIKNENK